MRSVRRRALGWMFPGTILAISILFVPAPAAALDVGQPAPDFKLPSTSGAEVSLGDFKGKKWVFLEFYGLDFQPT